jgi:hypothetical protein
MYIFQNDSYMNYIVVIFVVFLRISNIVFQMIRARNLFHRDKAAILDSVNLQGLS